MGKNIKESRIQRIRKSDGECWRCFAVLHVQRTWLLRNACVLLSTTYTKVIREKRKIITFRINAH